MGNLCGCIQGDSKKPSKKRVKKEPYSTTKVTSGSTFNENTRRYAVHTNQCRRPPGSRVKKKRYPQEDDFHHTVFSNLERLDKLQPTLEASEESLVHKDRGDGERPVNARVVQVAPLRRESTPHEDAIHDITNEDATHDIVNEDTVHDITNEAADKGIANEDAAQSIANE
ncbi:uncharacterized protein, partial [Gorilla gorilla gorilla]|uniref:uncharacterized protein n=1 Tax=Gorilla gorilla gorilla TaxID=9595 RepID=UPI00300AE10F